MIELTPTGDHPIPFDLSDEQHKTHKDSIAVAANTAEMLEQLSGPIQYGDEHLHSAAERINDVDKPTVPRHITSTAEAKAASVLIKKFDFQAFADIQQARTFITNKLIQISDCGDPKVELRALELLGKHSDIGLFTERSEITVHHKNSSDLENSIRERIKILLHSDVTDVEPLINELETKPVQVEDDVPSSEGENERS